MVGHGLERVVVSGALIGLLVSCHAGNYFGTGTACDVDNPCRSYLTCTEGQCQPADGATATAAVCDPLVRFADPILVPGLNRNLGDEQRMHLSADELTVYVAWGTAWWLTDIYVATRTARAQPFGPLAAVSELNSSDAELSLSLTSDGLTLFLDSNRNDDVNVFRIYQSTRSSLGQPFSTPAEVILNQDPPDQSAPYVLPDGTALYFQSLLTGTYELYRSALHGIVPEAPVRVSSISSQWGAQYPVVSGDELTIYFSSARADPAAHGNNDIWMVTRPSADVPFGTPRNVAELNTADFDFPQWTSLDGCRLYFTRSGTDGYVSYMADRVDD